MARKKKIDMTDFNSIPDYSGYCPDCPECGETMGYNYYKELFRCPACGFTMDENDWDYEAEEDFNEAPPWGCKVCGGPWPDCTSSCSIYNN